MTHVTDLSTLQSAATIRSERSSTESRGLLNCPRADERVCSYVVTSPWILNALLAGAASPMSRGMELPMHAGAFRDLLPLLRHGALDSDQVPAPDPNLGVRLGRSFTDPLVRGFVADARKLARDRGLALRNRAVQLRTENALTGRFLPPAASTVPAALTAALKLIDPVLDSHRGYAGKTVLGALLGSQILLTIHPFRDGNGRTARMFFAAKLLRHVGPAPTALLGMLLMQRAGAHQYHQASWALRAGDVEPMVALFVESEKFARERVLHASANALSRTELLDHCWRALREARQCGTFSGLASNRRE